MFINPVSILYILHSTFQEKNIAHRIEIQIKTITTQFKSPNHCQGSTIIIFYFGCSKIDFIT